MEKTREQVQEEALSALKRDMGGTVVLDTGTGKSKVAIDFAKVVYESHTVLTNEPFKMLITSPRTNLKKNWREELDKWGFPKDVEVILENIQTTYKWKKKFNLVIVDEIHTAVTPEYSAVFELDCPIFVGLTATTDITVRNGKADMYIKHCPVVYEYHKSAEDGLINKTRILVYEYELNDDDKVKGGTKAKPFMIGEAKQYEYLTKQIKKGQMLMTVQGSTNFFDDAGKWFWRKQGNEDQKFAAMTYLNGISYRRDFLLNLTSTARIAKEIKDHIINNTDGKVLIFSERTDQVDKVTKNTIHSKQEKEDNAALLEKFNKGEVRELGSCKSLELGLNLTGAGYGIMESYLSSSTNSRQRKGRLDRLDVDDVAKLVVIKIKNTQNEKWFDEMIRHFNEDYIEYYTDINELKEQL